MRDAEGTRARILDAATAEFAAHGIAGARVDRVAARAGVSKAMLYNYFGNKDALFDVAFSTYVMNATGRLPFTAEDLPGYARRLYDVYVADPALIRLVTWKRLERTPTGYLFDGLAEHDAAHLAALRDAQAAGTVTTEIGAEEIWQLLVSLASTWAQSAVVHAAHDAEDEDVHERRRHALAAAVQGAFATSPPRPARSPRR